MIHPYLGFRGCLKLKRVSVFRITDTFVFEYTYNSKAYILTYSGISYADGIE